MNLVVYVSDALRVDHVGCYGARFAEHADDRRARRRRRALRPGDQRRAVDGALDGLDDHRPLPAPPRLPPLGRRARPRARRRCSPSLPRTATRRAASSSTRATSSATSPDANVAGTSETAGRRGRVAARASREAVLPLVPQLDDAHALRRAPLGARRSGARRRRRSSPASSPSDRPRSRRCARATGRRSSASRSSTSPASSTRSTRLGLREQTALRVRLRPRRVVGRALRRQEAGQGHVPHARRDALRRDRPVPLILSAPGPDRARRRRARRCSLVDLMPTLLELAGAPIDGLDGTSLLPLARRRRGRTTGRP